VFHHHYYDVITRVKCSLSRSDGDSNRFLTSWWFIPHTNHTHRSSELQITNDTIPVNVTGQTGALIPRDHPTARNQTLPALGLTLRAPVISLQHQYAHPCTSRSELNNVTSFAVEKYFIRPAKCEACVQHDKRDKQRSILNRYRWKTTSTPEHCLVVSDYSARSLVIF
jgi:hypothetical protein